MDGLLCWIEAHQGLAAWVQAIGSIAAIIGAGRIARREISAQHELQQAAEQRSRIERLDGFIALAEVALQEVDTVVVASTTADKSRHYAAEVFEPKGFVGNADALGAFPIHEIGQPAKIASAHRFRDGFIQTLVAVQRWVSAVRSNDVVATQSALDSILYGHMYLGSQLSTLRK